ncbi:hypothetical protein BANRA_05451 [Klebsiella pneumoniae]|nr:hypothetical protein BANRA_05451 [Klebsiella pneumoniae]
MRKTVQALGRLKAGQMNKTETAYAQELELRKRYGEIAWYRFEGIKLRLADNTFYTPDFAVMLANGQLEMHEVKGGYWTDDARVKTKVAADQYPFRIIGVTKLRQKPAAGGRSKSSKTTIFIDIN